MIQLAGRELQIARLVVKGLTDTEMAQELTVSPSTISTYVMRLRLRFSARNRVELALKLSKHDLSPA